MPDPKSTTWNLLLLLIRVWLSYRLMAASYSSVTGILFKPEERAFFIKWFGNELHFPAPLLMAFLAKGSELVGGFLMLPGLFTRIAAAVAGFTMIVATLVANLGADWVIDGGFTISYSIFAFILIYWGAGTYSLDHWLIKRRKSKNDLPDRLT